MAGKRDAELRAYHPSWGERLSAMLARPFEGLDGNNTQAVAGYKPAEWGRKLSGLLQTAVPPVGLAVAADDMSRAGQPYRPAASPFLRDEEVE